MIIYRQFEKTYADDIYKLQNEWVKENITYGYYADSCDEIIDYNKEYCYVAIHEKQIIGYVTAEMRVNDGSGYMNVFPKGADFLQMNDLYVSPAYRSNHIGERLLSLVEEKAKENNIEHFYLSSATKDAEAVRRFYQRNGYRIWTTVFFK
ncbi:MAG: GNAT family N-acetyltransferase [Oscillospiraceae bacterium]|nr:GNAT family N-acetyltransferase [Oscillospiraceae bacterium]